MVALFFPILFATLTCCTPPCHLLTHSINTCETRANEVDPSLQCRRRGWRVMRCITQYVARLSLSAAFLPLAKQRKARGNDRSRKGRTVARGKGRGYMCKSIYHQS
ncbi:hypothetical protein QBC47DRAFT_383405 [Echria macrotheca]|uniref:Secreted protein n=1 Tax=Echria macrotheca TaxID=438768 RepID=A0AAJ0FBN1_9PEZI|nr:hypothetical protein QBC47DRAFT_383405 [Echria macrotheca]